jgi:hypothetical protein
MHNLIVVARNTFGSTAISPLEKTGDPKTRSDYERSSEDE